MGNARPQIVIATKSGNPTVSRLQSLLNAEVHSEPFDAKGAFLLRWGADYGVQNAKASLNTAAAIKRTKKKLQMLNMLRENDVFVPNETDKPPCIARWDGGSRGEGIQFCKKYKNMETAKENGAGAFLEWIQIQKEYRVHIMRGKVVSLCEKQKTRGADKLIRSVSRGWKFCDNARIHMVDAVDLISSSISAVATLKLDFGAVDIAMSKQHIPIVFEVNTAPGLNYKRANLYAKSIQKWISSFN